MIILEFQLWVGNIAFVKIRSGVRNRSRVIIVMSSQNVIYGEYVCLSHSMDKSLWFSLRNESALVVLLQSSKKSVKCELFSCRCSKPSTNMLCSNFLQVQTVHLRGRLVRAQKILKGGLLKTQEVNNLRLRKSLKFIRHQDCKHWRKG